MDEYITVQLDISDIKAKIKIHKSTQKNIGRSYKAPCHYDINENRYNALYVLDCYEILGGEWGTVFKMYSEKQITANQAM